MMPQRVVFVSMTHPYYDTRILYKEAATLAEAGYEVIHLAPAAPASSEDRVAGVRIVSYHVASGRKRLLQRSWQLWRHLRAMRPDVCHCNEVESWLVGCLYKLSRPTSKLVFDVHEHYPSRFEESRFPPWSRVVGPPIIRLLYTLLIPWTDHVIFAKRTIAPDFRPRPGQSSFVFNYAPAISGSDAGSGNTTSQHVKDSFGGSLMAIHIGAISESRGWPQLVQALTLTHEPWHVLQLGEIREGSSRLLAHAQSRGVAERIKVLERVPYEHLLPYLESAAVGLMLYQPGLLNHVYAFPMKLYDYMRAGLPVIGPAFAPEVQCVVEPEDCGWLIDTSDPTALANVLDAIAEDPDLAKAKGQRGRVAASERYTWESQARTLTAIYSQLLGGPCST